MRKIGVCLSIAALAAVNLSPSPGAAFGLSLGPFHIGLPIPGPFPGVGHRHAITPREAARSKGLHDEAELNDVAPAQVGNSDLLYPAATAPGVLEEVFWPSSTSWPFSYNAVLQNAFAKPQPDSRPQVCQQPNGIDGIAGRIQNEIRPTGVQLQQLQRLGGALHVAGAYLAKTCPNDVPAQPVARLQLMEWQIEKVAEALDIVRQPLQAFEQSLNAGQRDRLAHLPAANRAPRRDLVAAACAANPADVDSSIGQITAAVEPADAQRTDLDELKRSFSSASSQLEAACPTKATASPLARLENTEARLDAAWRAVVSMQVALANFEAKLSDQQRARFDATKFAATQ
jgi:hypothetical protein